MKRCSQNNGRVRWDGEISMGDKSPKDKNKKQAQKSAVQAKDKDASKKQQQSFDRSPAKSK
jgi:hypothetical protein